MITQVLITLGVLGVLFGLIKWIVSLTRSDERSKSDARNAEALATAHHAYSKDPGKAVGREDLKRREAERQARRAERAKRGV